MSKYMTVVYKIEDNESFKSHYKSISDRFETDSNDWSVVALSADNEIVRLEVIEDALSEGEYDRANQALMNSDIGNTWEDA